MQYMTPSYVESLSKYKESSTIDRTSLFILPIINNGFRQNKKYN